jgi:hypothetical protein
MNLKQKSVCEFDLRNETIFFFLEFSYQSFGQYEQNVSVSDAIRGAKIDSHRHVVGSCSVVSISDQNVLYFSKF